MLGLFLIWTLFWRNARVRGFGKSSANVKEFVGKRLCFIFWNYVIKIRGDSNWS